MKRVYSINLREIGDEHWPGEDTIALIQSTAYNDLSDAYLLRIGYEIKTTTG